MNPQTQNQPDFNFILSQPGPGDPVPKKKRSPLVWLLAGLLVLAILVVGALMFVAPSKNVQNTAFPVTDTSDIYLEHLKDSQYDAAYELLGSSTKAGLSLNSFKEMAQPMYGNIDLAKCQRVSKDTASLTDNWAEIYYTCPVKEGTAELVVTIVLAEENETIRISDVSMGPKG